MYNYKYNNSFCSALGLVSRIAESSPSCGICRSNVQGGDVADRSRSHKSKQWYDDRRRCTHGSPTSSQIPLRGEETDGVAQGRDRRGARGGLVLVAVADGQPAAGLTPDGIESDFGAVA